MDQTEHAMNTHHDLLRTPRRLIRITLAAVLAAFLTGCWQRSVHPFHTEADVIAEPALAGAWRQAPEHPESPEPADERMSWKFTPVDATRYDLVITVDRERYAYVARAFRLGTEGRFLDLHSKARQADTIPAHHLFRLLETGNTLKVSALSTEWVTKWLREHPGDLAHAVINNPDKDDELVLTADTAILQRFVKAHLRDEGFFTEALILEKDGASTTQGR